ncbi:sex peptide receptor-like [Planococcus citri]|uniref:sex peptide receptor-like n=1 Tax=Planococcus citri TaxID=170843 RepID=UPI0031F83913
MPRSWQESTRQKMYSVKEQRVYEWELISLFSWHTAATFHQISIWLTIMLAVWRYIAIAHPLKERQWCSLKTTKIFIAAGYVVYPVVWIPTYFLFRVATIDTLLDNDGNLTSNRTIGIPSTIFQMQEIEASSAIVVLVNAFYALVPKLGPIVVLSVYSYKLIVALLQAKNRRQELNASMHKSNATNTKNNQSTDRTTKMILVVLGLFFIAEMPHACSCILTAMYGYSFYLGCYVFVVEIFNFLTLFCMSVNFLVYYIMSQQFRNTFHQLFKCNKASSAQQNPGSTLSQNRTSYNTSTSTRSNITMLSSTPSSSTTTL